MHNNISTNLGTRLILEQIEKVETYSGMSALCWLRWRFAPKEGSDFEGRGWRMVIIYGSRAAGEGEGEGEEEGEGEGKDGWEFLLRDREVLAMQEVTGGTFETLTHVPKIADWAFDVAQAVSVGVGRSNASSVGRIDFGAVRLTMYVDQYSPILFTYLATGTPWTATLAWVTTNQAPGCAGLKNVYYFGTALLSGLSHSKDDERSLEKLSFQYALLAMGCTSNALDGSQAVTTRSWNLHGVSRQQVTFKESLQWLREPVPSNAAQASSKWKVEVLSAHVDEIKKYIVPLTRLVSALGFEPEDARTVADTVVFNSYVEQTPGQHSMLRVRRFYLSDNAFGIYWVWYPADRCTKVFMYGMSGEGTRQMQHAWNSISSTSTTPLSSPFLVGTVALAAEVVEMRRWIASQSDDLVKLHIETDHHDYPGTEHRTIDQSKLSDMSRDVCGFAINISTSVLCLQRIMKFANFLVEENKGLDDELRPTFGADAGMKALHEEVMRSQVTVKSQTQVWRWRADALLDEAETWKHKASILVQTVFTLTTQRDTGISIQVAQDSRTLAQKATRDSTSMKAIAAVTMCFLPGTFIASLFAMPMFEWPRAPGEVVSSRFWIYWAVTLPLTLVVIVLWLSWTSRKDLREWYQKSATPSQPMEKEASAV